MATLLALDTLMVAINRLTEVMDSENAALRQRDWKRVATLASDKRCAIHAYESALLALDGADVAPPTDAERALVHAASERLAAATEENERRLAMVIFAQRRVIAAISEAVIAAGNSAATYGRTGGIGYGRASAAPIAVAINGAF